MISQINWGEIIYMLPKKFQEPDRLEALAITQRLPFVRISVDDDLVDAATELKKIYACSYADCFAAALAMRFNAPLVTGDRELLKLSHDGLIQLEWLGA